MLRSKSRFINLCLDLGIEDENVKSVTIFTNIT